MKKIQREPTISLATLVKELELINLNVFELKSGAKMLIEAVEQGDIAKAKAVLEICELKSVLAKLNPEQLIG